MVQRGLAAAVMAVWVLVGAAAAADLKLALKGYDPVAYFSEGKPTPGKPEFEMAFDAARYRFASARHMELFKANPDRYLPQFAGSCAMAMSNGVKVEAEPSNWLIVDGKLFLFASASAPERMHADPQTIAARAMENWKILEKAPN